MTSRSGSSASSCSTTTFADEFDFDVLDATKLIPEELVPGAPHRPAGARPTVDNFFAETEQVAFCTQNIVPGIDFTNDPLLQGRNFSYLDTQLKRLGSPNFTHLPVNAPKCPVAHFQQDGHMAMINPVGRVNYEPNSWTGDDPGHARTRPAATRRSRGRSTARKQRVRSERFADHYSQARQFYVSQTPIEQHHIVDAFVFELSKCEQPGIRARMVANLRNVDEDFAQRSPTARPRLRTRTRRRRPGRRSPTCRRRLRSASSPTAPRRSPAARSASSSPTAPTPRCSTALRKAATAEGALVELDRPPDRRRR